MRSLNDPGTIGSSQIGRSRWRVALAVFVPDGQFVADQRNRLGSDRRANANRGCHDNGEHPEQTPVSVPDTAPLIKVDPALAASSLPVDGTKAVAVGDGSLWAWTDLGIVRWNLEDRNARCSDRPTVSRSPTEHPAGSSLHRQGRSGRSPGTRVSPGSTEARLSRPASSAGWSTVDPRCVATEECLNSITAMAVGPDGVLSLAVGEETLLQLDGTEWNVVPVTSAEVHGASVGRRIWPSRRMARCGWLRESHSTEMSRLVRGRRRSPLR